MKEQKFVWFMSVASLGDVLDDMLSNGWQAVMISSTVEKLGEAIHWALLERDLPQFEMSVASTQVQDKPKATQSEGENNVLNSSTI